MNRQEYKRMNRILRDNGSYALRWLSPQQLRVWEKVLQIRGSVDPLAERAKEQRYRDMYTNERWSIRARILTAVKVYG